MSLFQSYVPTVFENYTASFEIDKHRIELNMWDTSGKTAHKHISKVLTTESPTGIPVMLVDTLSTIHLLTHSCDPVCFT